MHLSGYVELHVCKADMGECQCWTHSLGYLVYLVISNSYSYQVTAQRD